MLRYAQSYNIELRSLPPTPNIDLENIYTILNTLFWTKLPTQLAAHH